MQANERNNCQHCWRLSEEAIHLGTVILAVRTHRCFREVSIVVVPCKRAQRCCASLRRSQNDRNVGTYCAKSLTSFKLYTTNANILVIRCKRMKQVGPNSVACCWPAMFRQFAWTFTVYTLLEIVDLFRPSSPNLRYLQIVLGPPAETPILFCM